MAAICSAESAWPTRRACQRPVSFSWMSSWPWMRASTFQEVSPCRTAMMRVASITTHCMEWLGVAPAKNVSASATDADVDAPWPSRRVREALHRGLEHGGQDRPGVAPRALVRGAGFVHDLLVGEVAHGEAHLSVEPLLFQPRIHRPTDADAE